MHSMDAAVAGGSLDGRSTALMLHEPAPGQEGRSTLFDAMGRPVPLAQAFSAATGDLPVHRPVAGRSWSSRRGMRTATPARSVNCFEPTYEPGELSAYLVDCAGHTVLGTA